MSDIHLSRELLAAAYRGEVSADFVEGIAIQHLSKLCPPCREEIRAFRRWAREGKAGEHAAALLLPALIERERPRLDRAERQARRDLAALLAIEPEGRLLKVKRAQTRFRGAELARLLIAECEKRVQADPEEAFHFADLARAVLNSSPSCLGDFSLLVLALAAMANARRAHGQLREAAARFEHVRDVMRQWGVTDPEITARVDELEGSLRKDQRLFDQAEELLARAEVYYHLAGDEIGAVRVLVKLGSTRDAQGRPEDAIRFVRKALNRIPPNASPRLYLGARYNLTYYLVRIGQIEEAVDLLEEDADLYRNLSDLHFLLRVSWLRGDIARARGEEQEAERAFREAWKGFIEGGIGYDAALVSLDLALLYLRQGRTAEVKRLAAEMVPIFQAQDVHREALAALALFQEAALREDLTVEQVKRLVKYLQEARDDPGRGFG